MWFSAEHVDAIEAAAEAWARALDAEIERQRQARYCFPDDLRAVALAKGWIR